MVVIQVHPVLSIYNDHLYKVFMFTHKLHKFKQFKYETFKVNKR